MNSPDTPVAPCSRAWSPEQSADLYGINAWGDGHYAVGSNGDLLVKANSAPDSARVSVMDVVRGMAARGLEMPAVLRIENLLDNSIKGLNEAFAAAIAEEDYNNHYRGVFPIKVNQQCHVIEEIAAFGRHYHHGFEVGSKAELVVALSQLQDHDSLIVCNGFKDAEFVELGLYARKIGIDCFFVLETPNELPIVLERSRALGVEPLLGVRIKSAVTVDGHWNEDHSDRSIFGLGTTALLGVVDQLRQAGMLHCLQLLHCHLGSQIPNIRNIRMGVLEACRFYGGLIEEGAPMGYLDLGGGLAVDYEGARNNSTHSMNYRLQEYCVSVVATIRESLDQMAIPHPVIVTESGRATVADSSMLLFNILDVRDHRPGALPAQLPADCHELLEPLFEVPGLVTLESCQECYNDALYYRDEIRELFRHGQASLRDRALAENITLTVLDQIQGLLKQAERVPPELENLSELLSDIYYGNFSLFQSLPDIWAIDQVFPVMPIHRLDERPEREAIIADITCDRDGKIDSFASADGPRKTLPLHPLKPGEDYYLGVFLVGAYQETLGDLHNLFGDTNVVSVRINEDGSFHFVREFHGDSIADVLTYVEYNPVIIQEQLRRIAEDAVNAGKISVATRQQMLTAFRASLSGYTYFEQ